jgi:hypothetical protein
MCTVQPEQFSQAISGSELSSPSSTTVSALAYIAGTCFS